jgi:hypothetical protein
VNPPPDFIPDPAPVAATAHPAPALVRNAEPGATQEQAATASQPTTPDLTNAHGGPWTKVGENHQGEPVFRNPNGVRAVFENGVPWTEATKAGPDGAPVPRNPNRRKPQFQVVEKAAEEITPAEPIETPKPRQKRESTSYDAVPKEPKRLIQFLREPTVINAGTIHEQTIPGGLRDVGGDVKATLGGAKGRPGLINNAAGRHLDDATLRAWEAGYFPEHDQRPEINDLLDAIRDDHEGNPRYSIHDQEAAEAHHDARAQNGEIDRLAAQHDIPTRGLTRDQFFDRLADRLEQQSLEEAAARHAEIDADAAAARDEIDHALNEWNPDHTYGSDLPRTLKDLENEYRQEDVAGTAREGGQDTEGRGRAASPEGAGEEGAGHSGSSDRSAGRDGAEGGADEGERRDVDLLGRPVSAGKQPRTPEPTIHDDPNQVVMPGMEPSARQAQAARDAAGPKTDQKRADEGLFARTETVQPMLVPKFPGKLIRDE